MRTIRRRRVADALGAAVAVVALALAGCGSDGGSGGVRPPADFVAVASDFECLQNWPRVRNIRLTNRGGFLDEALALAQNHQPGKQYPVGTIIQIFPGEAMVKRAPGYDPANNDWEYFELNVSASGTEIRKRGRDDVINMFGAQCFGCHEAAREFDFICEGDHGCIELPVTGAQIALLQDSDPRCAD
ncbi:MAG: hypothetical protein FJ148_27380 [Deltaproteobacteria bacterium]|nr:hypothetical protein [Deltaproteobacteria bacterium]